MNKIIKHSFYSLVWYSSLLIDTSYWAFWIEETRDWLIWNATGDVSLEFKKVMIYFLWFLWLIAVAWGMKWWFHILTAADDEEKVKKWKKTILFMLLWLFVILIAYAIVSWVIWWLWDVKEIEILNN